MRSVPAGSFTRLCQPEHLWQAWCEVRRGKRRGAAVATFDLDADRAILALARDLAGGCYRPGAVTLRTIQDPKVRLIAAPPVADRIVHQALISEIGPTYERGYLPQCFTRGPGVGTHHAVLAFLRLLRRYAWHCRLDIAGYFPAVDLGILEGLLFRRLADPDTRKLMTRLLDAGSRVYRTAPARAILGPPTPGRQGLALGSHLSQWCGNLYLDGLDHFVKRGLKIPGYLRYMDDFVLFGTDPAALAATREDVRTWLEERRRLALNPKHGQVRPARDPTTFLGYGISRAGITPSRKLRRHLHRRLDSAARTGVDAFGRCLMSYRGLLLFP